MISFQCCGLLLEGNPRVEGTADPYTQNTGQNTMVDHLADQFKDVNIHKPDHVTHEDGNSEDRTIKAANGESCNETSQKNGKTRTLGELSNTADKSAKSSPTVNGHVKNDAKNTQEHDSNDDHVVVNSNFTMEETDNLCDTHSETNNESSEKFCMLPCDKEKLTCKFDPKKLGLGLDVRHMDIKRDCHTHDADSQDEDTVYTLPPSDRKARHKSRPAPPRQSWLLRLFESKLFDMSIAITYLFNSKEPGVQSYIGK